MGFAHDSLVQHNGQRYHKVCCEKQNRSVALRAGGRFQQGYKRKSYENDSGQGDLALQIQSFGAIESHRGGRFSLKSNKPKS
jgi:hypothetical protein